MIKKFVPDHRIVAPATAKSIGSAVLTSIQNIKTFVQSRIDLMDIPQLKEYLADQIKNRGYFKSCREARILFKNECINENYRDIGHAKYLDLLLRRSQDCDLMIKLRLNVSLEKRKEFGAKLIKKTIK